VSTTGVALIAFLLTSAAPESTGSSSASVALRGPAPRDGAPQPDAEPGRDLDGGALDGGDDDLGPGDDDGAEPAFDDDPDGDVDDAQEGAAAAEPDEDEPDEDEPDEDDGELTLDDIFGTADDHVNVAPGPEEADVPAPQGGLGLRGRRQMWDNLDTRVRVISSAYYDVHRTEQRRFGRNENRLEFTFAYTPNKHIQIVGNLKAVFFGVAQAQELDDLATQQMLTPFHFESDSAYIALIDVLPNLDIKIGRQVLVWGTADKFNPTNNISPDDLEDRPLFTEPIGNQMVVVDYHPLANKLWFQGVYVPIFYPALLPPSASAALRDPRAPVPFARASDQRKLEAAQDVFSANPMLVPDVEGRVQQPPMRFKDGQTAVKVGTSLGGIDMSLSYYNGRHDIPTPIDVRSEFKDDAEGDGEGCCVRAVATLAYPRMQVLGADFATQLPFLGNMGLWGEAGLFFPEPQDIFIEFPQPYDVTPDDPTDGPVTFLQGPTIRKTPFVKATAGFDYTFGKHVYVQAQYVRGFIDDFGAGHIGNYVVGGTDLIFFGRHLILRLFGVVDVPNRDENASYVIFPALMVTPPWGSTTLELGSFFLLGPRDTKFGQPAAGTSIVFFKVTGTF
jgi:hypothetical protein